MNGSNPLTTHQKLSLGILLVLAITTFIFGMFRLKKMVVLPFYVPGGRSDADNDDAEQKRLADLKRKDTDKDGLNDYDELYVYRTSPYLDDTDSDGAADGAEVTQNSDPNCPKGKTCRFIPAAVDTSPAPDDTAAAPIDDAVTRAFTEQFGDISKLSPDDIATKLQKMSSVELRDFLVKIGIPATSLEKTTDEVLRQLLQQTIEEIKSKMPAGGTEQPVE